MAHAFGERHAELERACMQFAALLLGTGRVVEGRGLCAQGVAAITEFVPRDHIIRREAWADSPYRDWDGSGE